MQEQSEAVFLTSCELDDLVAYMLGHADRVTIVVGKDDEGNARHDNRQGDKLAATLDG